MMSDPGKASDKQCQSSSDHHRSDRNSSTSRAFKSLTSRYFIRAIALLLALAYLFRGSCFTSALDATGRQQKLTACAWSSLVKHTELLNVPGITRQEFLQRQDALAKVLRDSHLDAIISEPSATSEYYFNLSRAYELSERPFLVMLDASGQVSYLAPRFEVGRIRELHVVAESIKIIEWGEEENPYAVLASAVAYKRVTVDEHLRFMVAAGLKESGFEVSSASYAVRSIRSVKSKNEIHILKAINLFTIELVRSLQQCISPGVSQKQVTDTISDLFGRAGVGKDFWAIVLFGEQASSPHGGSTGRVLAQDELILLDVGSMLHGYGSDVTRTILPDDGHVSQNLMAIWNLVYQAQSRAIETMVSGTPCRLVDAAARRVITQEGYGDYFTHRLGHGLGLEMHEHPYLNGANEELLLPGNVATNEPGIYVTSAQAQAFNLSTGWGVRIEDALLVTESLPELLTGQRARSPWRP